MKSRKRNYKTEDMINGEFSHTIKWKFPLYSPDKAFMGATGALYGEYTYECHMGECRENYIG